jgi:hypothetical protein
VPYQQADAFGGAPQERSKAISTYLSCTGPFEVLADRGHRDPPIAVCSYLNWIGDAQVRFARLEGDLAGAQHQADDLSWSDTLSRARLVARRP